MSLNTSALEGAFYRVTFDCHEQPLPLSEGFHADLLQILHGEREEGLHGHGMHRLWNTESLLL